MRLKEFLLETSYSVEGVVDDEGCFVGSGYPHEIERDFSVVRNGDNLASLMGMPRKIKGSFSLSNTYDNHKLTSFKYAPIEIEKDFFVSGLKNLKSINGLGSIGNDLNIYNSTLVDNPFDVEKSITVNHDVKFFNCHFKTGSIVGINDAFSRIGGKIIFTECYNIKEGGLGLMLIDGLTYIKVEDHALDHTWSDFTKAMIVINGYLENRRRTIYDRPGERTIYDCQKELIDKGLERFAKL